LTSKLPSMTALCSVLFKWKLYECCTILAQGDIPCIVLRLSNIFLPNLPHHYTFNSVVCGISPHHAPCWKIGNWHVMSFAGCILPFRNLWVWSYLIICIVLIGLFQSASTYPAWRVFEHLPVSASEHPAPCASEHSA
jgi:hypothetical protein